MIKLPKQRVELLEISNVDAISIKDVRCFIDTEWIRIAPLTILVGENSTGKSTFLAATRLAWDMSFRSPRLDFNEDPFLLGAYDQIAHVYGGKGGRARSFELGLRTYTHARPERAIEFTGIFKKRGSQSTLITQKISSDNLSLTIGLEDPSKATFSLKSADSPEIILDLSDRFPLQFPFDYSWEILTLLYRSAMGKAAIKLKRTQNRLKQEDLDAKLERLFLAYRDARSRAGTRPYAFAPVRMKPQRTYDPVQETKNPEGQHVPMALARTFFTDKASWKQLKADFDKFGQESGLFDSLEIKTLGQGDSDPFQLRVRQASLSSNMIDVGYGVSQILPIIFESISRQARQDTFLMQQPEVHLHPRAQAALASFFASLAKNSRKRFIVETHSDFLIDRLRIELRKGTGLKPEDIAILYFEKSGRTVKIHDISMDKMGNLLGCPPSYRQFFLKEEQEFLGF